MGLDQFLFEGVDSERKEIGYWRKHPDLHGFVEELWRARNSEQECGSFNCEDLELSEEDILQIINCSKDKSFSKHDGTKWFFFGQTDGHHHEKTVEIMENALQLKRQGKRIFYSSWW